MAELFDVLFDGFKSSKKSVNRLLSVWLIFVLLGYLYVLEPYFWYKNKEIKTRGELANLETDYEQHLKERDRIKLVSESAEDSLKDIERQISEYPTHLKIDIIPQISCLSLPLKTCSKVGEFFLPLDIETKMQGVKWYIMTWFNSLLGRLENEVWNPIIRLKSGYEWPGEFKLDKLGKTAMNFQEFLKGYGYYGDDDDLLGEYEKLMPRIQREVKTYFKNLKKEVDKILNEASDKMAKLEKNIAGIYRLHQLSLVSCYLPSSELVLASFFEAVCS